MSRKLRRMSAWSSMMRILFMASIKRQGNREGSAAPFLAFTGDTTAVQFDAAFDDEKSQTRAGHVFHVSAAMKSSKQPRLIRGRNANALVADLTDRVTGFTRDAEMHRLAFV